MTPLLLPAHIPAVAGLPVPARARPAGYAALMAAFELQVPAPDTMLAIGATHTLRHEGRWRILTPRYRPADTIAAHLTFALKHEGVDLGVLAALFRIVPRHVVEEWVRAEPIGRHSRRAWFLCEWLTGIRLDLPNAPPAPYADVLDGDQQFGLRRGEPITRHRVRNNLPGTPDFCPLARRSDRLTGLLKEDLAAQAEAVVRGASADLMARAAAYLLLDDSKASYAIEGERPPQDRLRRWSDAIAEAHRRRLDAAELLRLQRLALGDARFLRFGWRSEGGFVGPRDRESNAPLPDHISARPDDLARLIGGLIAYADRSERGALDPVAAAAAVAFGFVFIHPFEDGNGRIHRWLMQHMLGRRAISPAGVTLPVSAALLKHIAGYRAALEHYSRPRLALTLWETTPSLNVRVVNATADLFRFFDVTRQAEFLAECLAETVRVTLPREVEYLRRYDQARYRVAAFLEFPDTTFDLMMGFLRQNGGRFSHRARTREFERLTQEEAAAIEEIYRELLLGIDRPGATPSAEPPPA